jgi:hypothetical protein
VVARVLSNPGQEYGIYLDGSGPTEAALDLPAGRYTGDWVNVRTGSIEKSEAFEHPGGGKVLQAPEFQNGIALRLKRAGP